MLLIATSLRTVPSWDFLAATERRPNSWSALNAKMVAWRAPILLSLMQLSTLVLAVAKCYYPDGEESTTDQPCNSNIDVSPCCGTGLGNVCLSNLLCQGSDGNIVRGSCTDQNWGEGCALYCLGTFMRGLKSDGIRPKIKD